MKTILRLSFIAIFTIVFTSCENLGLTAPGMDSEEAVNRVIEAYKENFDTSKSKPTKLNWFETDKLSNELSYLSVYFVDKETNKSYYQSLKIGGDNQKAGEIKEQSSSSSKNNDFENQAWIQLSDINPEVILQQINDAKSQIPEEYAFRSVNSYTLSIDYKTKKPVSSFTIYVVEKDNATSLENGKIVTTYYEMDFDGLPDGSIKLREN